MGEKINYGREPQPPQGATLTDVPGSTRRAPRRNALKQSGWYRLPKVEKMATFIQLVTAHGWKVTSRGWPKFLCWSPDGKISLAYVLKDGRKLSRVQRFVAYQFSQCGVPVYTWSKSGGFMVFDPQAYRLAYAQRGAPAKSRQKVPLDPDPVRALTTDDILHFGKYPES